MKNKLKPLFALCLLLTTCVSLISFANSNSRIVYSSDIVVTDGKDLKELNLLSDKNAKTNSWFVAWSSSHSNGWIGWESNP